MQLDTVASYCRNNAANARPRTQMNQPTRGHKNMHKNTVSIFITVLQWINGLGSFYTQLFPPPTVCRTDMKVQRAKPRT